MSQNHELGRAEFDESIQSCFEDIPIQDLMAPLFFNKEPKLIIGERGVGKTHLLKVLSTKVPIEHYVLDKEQLFDGKVTYTPLESQNEPELIIIDDLHYLLKAMYVIKLDSGDVSEQAIINNLNKFKKYSQKKNSTLVFVSDEGVSGLSLRFDEKNRRKFLELFGNCVDTPDDAGFLMKYIKNTIFSTTRNNVLNLNNRGTLSFYRNQTDYLKNVEFNQNELKSELLGKYNRYEKKLLNASENVVNEFKMVDIPFGTYGTLNENYDDITYFHYFTNDEGNLYPFPYLVERNGISILTKEIDNRYETYKYSEKTQFASFRQLKILFETFDEITMEKLKIDMGKSFQEEISGNFPFELSMKFTINDLRKIVWKLHRVIKKTIGTHSYKELASRITNTTYDPLIEYLLYDLEFE